MSLNVISRIFCVYAANKTVRFEVDQSTTEVASTSHAVNVGSGQNLSNIDHQRREEQRSLQVTASSAANQRTNLSLVEIQKIYHEQVWQRHGSNFVVFPR